MKPDKTISAIIQAAATKGIRDIKDDPKRGIRNLVELAEGFSKGRFQRSFFDAVLRQLKDNDSVYYQIVDNAIKRFDEKAIITFGMNLGYNSLTHGASIIREIEETEGFNVPWCLSLDIGGDSVITPEIMENTVIQGKEMGIYSYFIYHNDCIPLSDEYLSVMIDQANCAFVLFCNAEAVDVNAAELLTHAKNVVTIINLDGGDDEARRNAASLLMHDKLLCGGYSCTLKRDNEGEIFDILGRAEQLNMPVVVFLRERIEQPVPADDIYNHLVYLRENPTIPVLPIDLFDDIAFADGAISSEACVGGILESGEIYLSNLEFESQNGVFNIKTHTLREALSTILKKR